MSEPPSPEIVRNDSADRQGADRLLDTLERIAAAADKGDVTLGDIACRLEERGFGPILTLLGALIALPTGAIPGLPAVVGLVLILFALQLLIGRHVPWLPRRLDEMTLSHDLLARSISRARPTAARLGRMTRPHLRFLATNPLAKRAIALVLLINGLILIPIGFIPFLPIVMGVNLICFGIGLTAHDGRAILLGAAFFLLAGAGLAWHLI